MLNKSFVAIAMLSFVFTATAFGQKEIVVWSKAKASPTTAGKAKENATRTKTLTGSDEELGALVAWSHANQKPGRKPKTGSLIDTSTGEIVWADEVKGNQPNSSRQRTNRRPKTGNLIDTSTGEIVWVKRSQTNSPQAPGSRGFDKGYLPPNAKARKHNR